MLIAGDGAPDFSGPDILGSGPFKLSDHANEVVCLLQFSHTCPVCKKAIPIFEKLWKKYQNHGVQFVGMDKYTVQASELTALGITFPCLKADDTMWKSYAGDAPSYPYFYVIARNLVIHYSNPTGVYTDPVYGDTFYNNEILDAIYYRDPIDLEMIMDVSDSMNYPQSGGDSKLVMMKRSTKMILDFLNLNGQADDKSGLVWFTDNASEYDSGNQKLLPVKPNINTLKDAVELQGTGICTAMGAGLQKAFDTLKNEGKNKRVAILLTDGIQNIEPKLTKVGTHYEIIDSGGWICGNHSSTSAVAGKDISDYETTVNTIGVGISATYSPLLQDLANEMGGIYLGTNDPATDLDLIYFVDLCNCMAGGSPAIVHHHAGIFNPEKCQVIERFYLNRSVQKFTVILSWEKILVGSLAFWLRAPDGTLLDLYRDMKLFDAYCMATVYLPAEPEEGNLLSVGEWQMIIHGETNGSASYHSIVIADDREVHFKVKIPNRTYEIGDIVPIQIQIKNMDEIVVHPSEILLEKSTLRVPVTELLARYNASFYQLIEKTGLKGKNINPDPVLLKLNQLSRNSHFKEQLLPVRTKTSLREGTLECHFTENKIIVPVHIKEPGLNTFRIEVLFESKQNGPISRVTMASIQAGTGRADSHQTIVHMMSLTRKRTKGAIISVTPRNTGGYLLGPGMADEFGINFGEKHVTCTVDDLLNGTYQVEFEVPSVMPEKGQPVILTLQGKKIWGGLLN